MSSSGEMKMSLKLMTCNGSELYMQMRYYRDAHILVPEVLEQLQLSVRALR